MSADRKAGILARAVHSPASWSFVRGTSASFQDDDVASPLAILSMWLLNAGTLKLEYCVDEHVFRYAILSHTWSDGEMTFQDINGPRPETKAGYTKIQATCQQALKDGYQCVWVDTCCIKKESSAEHSEAN